MAVKKKTPIPKSAEKRNAPETSPPQEGINGQTGRAITGAKTSSAALPRETGPRQMESFEEGMRLFHARVQSGTVLNTAEEHYNYAITLINSRDLAMAQKHLRAALDVDSTADHVLYALAACQSLGGDLQAGYENLKRAIDLQPHNRLAARQDPDFTAMAGHPGFIRLLYPEKKD